jgi:hypothetical protein
MRFCNGTALVGLGVGDGVGLGVSVVVSGGKRKGAFHF